MVMVPNLGAAHTAKKFFRPICASAVETVNLLMVDPPELKPLVQFIP
jgi:hypothetical protein